MFPPFPWFKWTQLSTLLFVCMQVKFESPWHSCTLIRLIKSTKILSLFKVLNACVQELIAICNLQMTIPTYTNVCMVYMIGLIPNNTKLHIGQFIKLESVYIQQLTKIGPNWNGEKKGVLKNIYINHSGKQQNQITQFCFWINPNTCNKEWNPLYLTLRYNQIYSAKTFW